MGVSNATSVRNSSSSAIQRFGTSKPAGTTPFVIVTKTVPTSTTTVLHSIAHSNISTTVTVKEDSFTTLTVDSASEYPNSIADTRVLQQSASSPLPTTPLVSSSFPVETTASVTLTTLDPTSTTSEISVSTFVTASTDSLGVHTFTKVTTIAHFQPNNPSSTPERDLHSSADGSSPNIPMIILVVLGITVACALALFFTWWCRGRRRAARDNHIYPFSDSPETFAWRQRFGRAFGKHPYFGLESNPRHTINRCTDRSFGNNHGRETTPRPFLEQTSTDVIVIGNPGLSSPHVRFEKQFRDSESDSEDRTERRTREGTTQRDRPPTYHTNSTGLATIATTLPLYSAIDPSPISERSDTSTTPTASTPLSPFLGRRAQSSRFLPRTPMGKKF